MRRIFSILLLITAVGVVAAQVLTARSRLALSQGSASRVQSSGHGMVQAMVTVSDNDAIDNLLAAGAIVNTVTGNIVTVQIPDNAVGSVAAASGVKCVSLAQRLTLTNDSARILSAVDPVHEGLTLSGLPYTGKGVIVGLIDSGVDFNHINLCDDQGRSRVIAAYLPCDATGTPPVVEGHTLPGSHYNTTAQISTLTADNTTMSHGTHTAGTAVGSYRANGMHGVAPEAELVVCAMPDSMLTDVNVANSVKYIMDVARRENKPVVINMSIGDEVGPHDGTSMLCRLFDEVSGPGRICVVSAANNAHRSHVIDRNFKTNNDTLYTCIAPYGNHDGWIPGYVSSWSSTAKPHTLSITAVSKSSGKIVYSKEIAQQESIEETVVIDAKTDPEFARYFVDGKVEAAAAVEDCNGHYHTIAEVNVLPVSDDIALGMSLTAPAGDRVTTWAGNGLVFTRNGISYMTSGMKSMSINELACGDSAISVGAYCSRKYMPLEDGTLHVNSRAVLNDIAYFSGYGPDVRGIARPDVTAPGFSLVSSASRYDHTSATVTACRAPGVTVDGEYYVYGSQYGTSMSTPVVTGAIALWLEQNPKLGPEQVRDVIKATSVQDAYTAKAPAIWGAGKINVAAGVDYLLKQAGINEISSRGLMLTPNPCNGDFCLMGFEGEGTVIVYDMQGRVQAQTAVSGDNPLVHLSGTLDDGIYMVRTVTCRGIYANKIIVKH